MLAALPFATTSAIETSAKILGAAPIHFALGMAIATITEAQKDEWLQDGGPEPVTEAQKDEYAFRQDKAREVRDRLFRRIPGTYTKIYFQIDGHTPVAVTSDDDLEVPGCILRYGPQGLTLYAR